ncbi:MAG: hypothetical protein WB696_05635 [Chthoniobacterales bacterium]
MDQSYLTVRLRNSGLKLSIADPDFTISRRPTADHPDIYLSLGSSDDPYDLRVTSVQGD